jgi:hypothetical protein
LEVLIAAMLLGAAAVIVFSAFGIGLRAASLAGAMNTATTLAEEALARAGHSSCVSASPLFNSDGLDDRIGRFSREVFVHSSADAHTWELTTTVTWMQERRRHSVTLKTLRYVSPACQAFGE